eukprot:TRINITY_DN3969_c0_g1_i1.p1 TRINITY_DN3969_c0_g1~~TRINITY_DN3969_c0_g1_i1.p1  ORF type:complete len:173 (+),score=51.29 TRINITY_DN3969_c0_g1_i1:45-521(+)
MCIRDRYMGMMMRDGEDRSDESPSARPKSNGLPRDASERELVRSKKLKSSNRHQRLNNTDVEYYSVQTEKGGDNGTQDDERRLTTFSSKNLKKESMRALNDFEEEINKLKQAVNHKISSIGKKKRDDEDSVPKKKKGELSGRARKDSMDSRNSKKLHK